jgi:hypothetical protein
VSTEDDEAGWHDGVEKMKKMLIGFIVVLMCVMGMVKAEAVVKIAGLQGSCDTTLTGCQPIPLNMTTLCTTLGTGCPFRASPSYTSSTKFWGANGIGNGSCIVSTDGGITWPACASEPFGTGSNEVYAEASDGSVIAWGTTTGPSTCTGARSINNATSWVTTFTLVENCSPGNLEGQYLFCLRDGRCEVILNVANTYKLFRSSDNGQSWTKGAETGSASCAIGSGASWDGSVGILPPNNPGCGAGNLATAFSASGDAWTISTAWTGTQGECWGSAIIGGVGYGSCGSVTTYGMYTSTGAIFKTYVLPGATVAATNGGVAGAYNSTTVYVLATATVPSGIGVYVSRDSATSFTRIGTETSGGGNGIRGGHMFSANGCMYWVGGGTTRRFAKIC